MRVVANIRNGFLGFLLICIPLTVEAATYYVSPSGSDTNPGTLTQPWLTEQPSQSLARPGDSVYFRGFPTYSGFYTNMAFTSCGTPGNPITYSAYPNEMPIINIGGNASPPDGMEITAANCIWNGFCITNGASNGIRIVGNGSNPANSNIIQNFIITGCIRDGINLAYGTCAWNTIRNCWVYNCSLVDYPPGTASWASGIEFVAGNCNSNLIMNCLVEFVQGQGVLMQGNGNQCLNCIIADILRPSMYEDGDNNLFSGNVTFASAAYNTLCTNTTGGPPVIQAYITQEQQQVYPYTIGVRGNRYINNLIINGSPAGTYIDCYQSPYTNYPFSDVLFANNTCIGNSEAFWFISSLVGAQISPYNNFHIVNNLYLPGPFALSPSALEQMRFSSNGVLVNPAYQIDVGNNVYDFELNGTLAWGTNSWRYNQTYGGTIALTLWMQASLETNSGSRASLWLADTNQANFIIANCISNAAAMPRLWQTNGGPAPDLDPSYIFTNLLTCSNGIDALRRQLAAPFRPLNSPTNLALTMGRPWASWISFDDYGLTSANPPLSTDLLGTPRSLIPAIGALEPVRTSLPPYPPSTPP